MSNKALLSVALLAITHQALSTTCHLRSHFNYELWNVSCKDGYQHRELSSVEGQALHKQIMEQMPRPTDASYYLCCKNDGHADYMLEKTPAYPQTK